MQNLVVLAESERASQAHLAGISPTASETISKNLVKDFT
jgi:hypothetical protein